MPDRADESAAGPSAQTGAEAVHLYEPFDRIDEIWFDIVLCKYVGRAARAGLELTARGYHTATPVAIFTCIVVHPGRAMARSSHDIMCVRARSLSLAKPV